MGWDQFFFFVNINVCQLKIHVTNFMVKYIRIDFIYRKFNQVTNTVSMNISSIFFVESGSKIFLNEKKNASQTSD